MESDSADYDAGALKQYVRQKEKPKLFSLFKNPFSRKPVIYDTLQARLTCQDLVKAMQNQDSCMLAFRSIPPQKARNWMQSIFCIPALPLCHG